MSEATAPSPLVRDAASRARSWTVRARDYAALAKPGIVVWLLITALVAMVVAGHGLPPLRVGAATLLGLALSAGGAHGVNMWYDRDIDPLMDRTRDRPVAAGRIPAWHALVLGIAGGAASLLLMGWLVNWAAALATLGGYVIYVFVYTIWLKRRTPQNIVIGGAAGAFPPLVGWAAATGHLSWAAALMFLLVFLWTPPHFWSLALYREQDYRRARIPMMPIVRGPAATQRMIVAYAVLTVAASVALGLVAHLSAVYLAAALVLGAGFARHAWRLLRAPEASRSEAARSAFRFSLMYLAAIFLAMVL